MMDDNRKKADMIFRKGQQIGQYRIIGTLDIGKLADTYLGQQSSYNTTVLIEVLRPPLLAEFQESFLTRARTLMKLDHPHILRLQDAGLENHYPFIITNHISTSTLRQMYPRGSRQPLTNLLPHLKQVADALQYAHDQKILHRDIRPENILLDENNQILLQGFTIEAITQNRERLKYQRANVMDETFAYTAPEQIHGNAQPASDQYSLAIVIYELLSGALPFTGSYLEIADKQIKMSPPPLRQSVPNIPVRIENAIMKALAKDPTQRFPDIQSFISVLEQEHNASSRAVARRRPLPPPVAPRPIGASTASSSAPPPANPPAQQRISPTEAAVPPLPTVAGSANAAQGPANVVPQNPVPPVQPPPPPIIPEQTFKDSTLAPRRGTKTMTRRAFAAGLVGLAAAGGAGGWYVLSRRLAAPTTASTQRLSEPVPATPTTVNNTGALIFAGHLAAVNALTWSPDGTLIASASDDKFVQIFDASSGRRKAIYTGHTEEVAAVAWSPNGKLIASGGQDGTAQVWHADTGKKIFTFRGHADRVNAVSWSNNNQQITSGSEDKTVQVWDAAGGGVSFIFKGHTAGVLCVGWQPDNSSVASGSWDGTLRDWATVQHGDHFNAGDQIFNYGGHGKNEVNALAWSPDGNFIVSAGADQTAQISNGINGKPRPPFFTGHQNKLHVNPVRSVAWSPDGDFIASGDADGNVFVWRVAGRKTTFVYRGHKKAVNAVAWSPDGKKIASASADNTVHVWQPS